VLGHTGVTTKEENATGLRSRDGGKYWKMNADHSIK
jgi:hypothetical protein